ncbi:MAG: hypothetical protein H7301_02220 [Cryobacterium sp.]|nr:hypothetical protein [Oligoflexia bacterium]
MSQNTIILISRNAVDYLFAEQVSKNLGVKFAQAESKDKLHEILCANMGCFILWDYDSVLEKRAEDARTNRELMDYFEKHRVWHRVFAISSHPLRDSIVPGNFHLFSKYIFRNFTLEATRVYSYIIHNILLPNPFETHSAGIDELQIQKSRITNSSRKKATLEALSIILEKKTIPKRIATSIIRATDELVLNAVFDAPVDMKGNRYKHLIDRGHEFDLVKKEEVEVELISTLSFLQVSVTDYFGSLDKEKFVPLLAKNFQKLEVNAPGENSKSDSGLGLYQILNSGLSMQTLIEPGKRTRMSLVVPWVANVRELRDSFRFFCLRIKN